MNACNSNKTESVIRRVAGSMVLLSVSLGWLVHPGWFLLTGFVGLNLLQSSFTRWCPLEAMLERKGKAGA